MVPTARIHAATRPLIAPSNPLDGAPTDDRNH